MDASPDPRPKVRDQHVDAVRGFAMLLVLLGHSIDYTSEAHGLGVVLARMTETTILSFHMPLFMMIAGFVVGPSIKADTRLWVLKKFRYLAIPYIIWAVAGFFVGFSYPQTHHEFFPWFWAMLTGIELPFWFIYKLVMSFLVLAAAVRLEGRLGMFAYPVALVVLILAAMTGTRLFALDYLWWYAALVMAGYLLGRTRGRWQQYRGRVAFWGAIVFLVGTVGFKAVQTFTPYDAVSAFAVAWLLALPGILGSDWLVSLTSGTRVERWLALLGCYTFGIYMTQSVFYWAWPHYVRPLALELPEAFALTGLALVATSAACWLLSRTDITSRYLLGRERPQG